MDRFRARSLSGRTYLHLLGLFPSALAEEFGIAHRSSFAQTPNWRHDSAVPASIAGSATGPAQATTRRPGSSWIWARRRKERSGSAVRSSGPTLGQRLRLVAIAG